MDVLLVPGDAGAHHTPKEKIDLLKRYAGQVRTLYVPGLKDLAGTTISAGVQGLRRAARGKSVRVLYRNRVDIEGVAFLGVMLWPSLDLMGSGQRNAVNELVRQLPEFQAITGSGGGALTPAEIRDEHARDASWLSRQLSISPHTPKIILSHFPPAGRSLGTPLSLESALRASPCEGMVKKGTLWVHGHVSQPVLYRLGRKSDRGLVASWPQPQKEHIREKVLRFWIEGGKVIPP